MDNLIGVRSLSCALFIDECFLTKLDGLFMLQTLVSDACIDPNRYVLAD